MQAQTTSSNLSKQIGTGKSVKPHLPRSFIWYMVGCDSEPRHCGHAAERLAMVYMLSEVYWAILLTFSALIRAKAKPHGHACVE